MKCDECKAYEQQADGHYECLAAVPDEMIKQFADGRCGCKYKSSTIAELMEMANEAEDMGFSLDGQMDLSMFLNAGSDSDKEVSGMQSSTIPTVSNKLHVYLPGDLVQVEGTNTYYTVIKQSEDRLVVYAKSPQSGTVVLSSSDLTLVEVDDK